MPADPSLCPARTTSPDAEASSPSPESRCTFIVAHLSFPQTEPERATWIARHVAYGGTDPANAESARHEISTRLSIMSPEDDEAMLRDAGFSNVSLFYAGLSFRGWLAYAE